MSTAPSPIAPVDAPLTAPTQPSRATLQRAFTSVPEPAAVSRWIEVLSHLDPRYGGLSSAVPVLGRSLAAGEGGVPFSIALAAFCAPEEQYQPAGYSAQDLSFWPVARGSWMRDRLHGNQLQARFEEQLRGVDGIHIHGLWEESTARAAAVSRRLGIPYILSAHGMLEPWALAQKKLKKLVYAALVERTNVASARSLHALTRAEAKQLRAFGAHAPIAVIPNAVDVPHDVPPALFIDRFPMLAGKRIVLFLARLHPKKGIDLLLQAWAKLGPERRDAHLVIAGPDCEGTRERLEQFVAREALGDSVLFPGMLHGAIKWSALAAAEAFVLPSWSEGLSMSALEAMGMGLPVIVTRPCNMPEVHERCAGWEIEPDAEQMLVALQELLQNDPAENAATGRRGADLIQSRYTPAVVATQMAELYRWTAGGSIPHSVDLIFPGKHPNHNSANNADPSC